MLGRSGPATLLNTDSTNMSVVQDPVVAPSYEYADKGYRHLRGLVEGLA